MSAVIDQHGARKRFAALAALDDESIDLAEGALLISAEEQGELDVGAALAGLEEIAAAVRPALDRADSELGRLEALRRVLYDELRFRGNLSAYYDPRNSYLDQVIERRLGIPITLAVLLIEVGRRVGIALQGVGFPAHFLVRYDEGERAALFLDPFEGGRRLGVSDCVELYEKMSGGRGAPFDPAFLDPVGPRQILARMVNNLKAIHLQAGNVEAAIGAIDRLLLLYPGLNVEYRNRGLLRLRQGSVALAIPDLERYVVSEPAAADRVVVEARITEARRKLYDIN